MVFTNLAEVDSTKHGMFESSNLKSSIVGNIYDLIVRDGSDKEIAVDNGVLVVPGKYTGDGLQTRYATVAKSTDAGVAVVGTPALIKDAFTKAQDQPYNFQNAAGAVSKAYELVKDDIFAIASYQITSGTVKVGDYIYADGTGGYVVAASLPSTAPKFYGTIHSVATGTYYTMVRIQVVAN